jgi:hypothetical protein
MYLKESVGPVRISVGPVRESSNKTDSWGDQISEVLGSQILANNMCDPSHVFQTE